MIKGIKRLWRGVSQTAPAPEAEVSVLMVCMGNICRSPTAEAVLRTHLERAGLQGRVLVDSAGTHGYHTGEPPDLRAIQHAAQRGYALHALRARPVTEGDFQRFDRILAMDADNLAWLQRKAPAGSAARLALLMTHAERHATVLAVPDPYYGPPAGFDHVLDLVEDACAGLVQALARELESETPSGSPSAKLD
jgi:protein-tyrosine phosphatase